MAIDKKTANIADTSFKTKPTREAIKSDPYSPTAFTDTKSKNPLVDKVDFGGFSLPSDVAAIVNKDPKVLVEMARSGESIEQYSRRALKDIPSSIDKTQLLRGVSLVAVRNGAASATDSLRAIGADVRDSQIYIGTLANIENAKQTLGYDDLKGQIEASKAAGLRTLDSIGLTSATLSSIERGLHAGVYTGLYSRLAEHAPSGRIRRWAVRRALTRAAMRGNHVAMANLITDSGFRFDNQFLDDISVRLMQNWDGKIPGSEDPNAVVAAMMIINPQWLTMPGHPEVLNLRLLAKANHRFLRAIRNSTEAGVPARIVLASTDGFYDAKIRVGE